VCLGFVARVAVAQDVQLPVLTRLQESDRLLAAQLTPKERQQIFEEVEAISFDVPDVWESELRLRRMALGSVEGLIIQGTNLLCGGTGNCETVVLRRSRDRWIAMFQREAPIGHGFAFLSHSSHGIKDFVVAANLSAESDRYIFYRFDGQYYRTNQCYEKNQSRVRKVSCQ
jgi:hypothetical protein